MDCRSVQSSHSRCTMAAVEQEVIILRKSPDAPSTLDNPTKELQKGSPEMAAPSINEKRSAEQRNECKPAYRYKK